MSVKIGIDLSVDNNGNVNLKTFVDDNGNPSTEEKLLALIIIPVMSNFIKKDINSLDFNKELEDVFKNLKKEKKNG